MLPTRALINDGSLWLVKCMLGQECWVHAHSYGEFKEFQVKVRTLVLFVKSVKADLQHQLAA